MADALKVTVKGAEYTLDIPADSTVVRAPIQREFFTEVDRVSAIQKAIGVDVTGVWDSATNEQFATWLRVQQATHIGIDQSDGWWGPKSEAALAGKIDPDALKALSELRESGRLNKLTYRTDTHNATWSQVESKVVELAAAPDANAAVRNLASTINGEEPAPIVIEAAPSVAQPASIVVEPAEIDQAAAQAALQSFSAAAFSAVVGAYFAGRTIINKQFEKPVADNTNTPRHFTDSDIEIIEPKKASTDADRVRPVADVIDRPIVEGEVNRNPNKDFDATRITIDAEANRVVVDAEIDTPRASVNFDIDPDVAMAGYYSARYGMTAKPNIAGRIAAIDGSAAIDLRIASPADSASPLVETHYARMLTNDPAFIEAAESIKARLGANLNASFSAAANNNDIVAAPKVDAYNELNALRIDIAAGNTPDFDPVQAVAVEAALQRPLTVTPTVDVTPTVAEMDPALKAQLEQARFNAVTADVSIDTLDVNINAMAAMRAADAVAKANAPAPENVAQGLTPEQILASNERNVLRVEVASGNTPDFDPARTVAVEAALQRPLTVTPTVDVTPAVAEMDPELKAQLDAGRLNAAAADQFGVGSPDADFAAIVTAKAALASAASVPKPEVDVVTPVAADIVEPAVERITTVDAFAEWDRVVNDVNAMLDVDTVSTPAPEELPSMEEIMRPYVEALPPEAATDNAPVNYMDATFERAGAVSVDPELSKALSAAFGSAALVVADTAPEVRHNLDDAPNVFRPITANDLSVLPSASGTPDLHIGQLGALRKLGSLTDVAGPMDAVIGMGIYVGVSSVTNQALGQRAGMEAMPVLGGVMAHQEGRTAEGNMRFAEDIGGVVLSAIGGTVGGGWGVAGGTLVAGPAGTAAGGLAGGVAGTMGGMIATIELSNLVRDGLRGAGFDVDEGMNSAELTSFVGSLSQTYPQLQRAVQGLDEAERTSLAISSMDVTMRHSQYSMEGLSSEEAVARIREDLINEDATLSALQAELLENVSGLNSLIYGQPAEQALANPETFSEVYRYYKAMAETNPEDVAMSSSVDNLASYNDIALQRINLQYGQVLTDSMTVMPQADALAAANPRDESLYNHYSNIIEKFDEMSPAELEQYSWLQDVATRHEERMALIDPLTEGRDDIAQRSRALAHIEDDINNADVGLERVTSEKISLEQNALIAQMGVALGISADMLRDDPNLIKRLEDRYEGSKSFPGTFWNNMTNGHTPVMNDDQANILSQFKVLETVRQHQLGLEASPLVPPPIDLKIEVFRRLPTEITSDMSQPMKDLTGNKIRMIEAEQTYADFKLEDAQDEIDFMFRRRMYGESNAMIGNEYYSAYNDIEMYPERFTQLVEDLGIGIEKPEGATHVIDYRYDMSRQPVAHGMQ
jgi:hypothetical protein